MKSFSNKKIISISNKKKNVFRFSTVGLIAKQAGLIPSFQIESIRLFIRRMVKKRAQIFFRLFPAQSITKKPNEIRLGRGKGNFKHWACFVQRGKLLIELSSQNTKLLTTVLSLVQYRIRIKSFILNKKYR